MLKKEDSSSPSMLTKRRLMYKMITKEIKKLIEENPVALATVKENKPHVIVVADVKVIADNQILIGDNYMKTTANNIKENHNVSLVVYNNDEGWGFEGIADYFSEGKWFKKIKEIHQGYPAKG